MSAARNPRVEDGPRVAAHAQGQWSAREAVVHGTRAGRESKRLAHRPPRKHSDWICGREVAIALLDNHTGPRRTTLGADKAYDTRDFVEACRELDVTPHMAQNKTNRRSAIDPRTTRHVGYSISQRLRMRIEQVFGWGKTIGGLRRTRLRGLARTRFGTYLVGAAYNLLRITHLRRELAT